MDKQQFHLQRLRDGLASMDRFRGSDARSRDPEFNSWLQDMIQSLDVVLPDANYDLRLANTRFRDISSPYTDYIPDHQTHHAAGLQQTELILRSAIAEAEASLTLSQTSVGTGEPMTSSPMDRTNVFLSRPTWLPTEFVKAHDAFANLLGTLGLRPRTLGTTDYPSRAPLDEVIDLMAECSGAIILGYPQLMVTAGTVKGKPISEPFLLPTEWNHIEAGLAHAKGLPLLAIHHIGIRRGIFDRGAMNAFLYERDLTDPSWPLGEDLLGAIKKWKAQCLSDPVKLSSREHR